METKHDWRYVPSEVTVHEGKVFYVRPVVKYIAHPIGQAPCESPIRRDMVTLQCITDTGHSAWYGVDEAMINSELKMIARGGYVNDKNELSNSWVKVKNN